MARNLLLPVLFILCYIGLSTQIALGQHLKITDDNVLSDTLLNKGYGVMGVFGLSKYLQHLLTSAPSELTHNITAITVFCPSDKTFINQYGIGPADATTLLQYHVVPFEIGKKTLESSPVGNTFPTFLVDGPPLVKTIVPYTAKSSINNVTISDWEIYNDGKVIVHGIDDFFDPTFPLLHPHVGAKEDACGDCKKNLNDHDGETPKHSGSSLLMKKVLKSPVAKVIFIATSASFVVLIVGVLFHRYKKTSWDQDLPVQTSSNFF